MTNAYVSYITLVGRLLLALMFILAGFGKLADVSGTAAYIASAGLPFPTLLAVAVGLVELLVAGLAVRWFGLALAVFTMMASVIFHAYWAAPADQAFIVQLLFMKNLSVAGGLLLISALGAGPLSIDARRGLRSPKMAISVC